MCKQLHDQLVIKTSSRTDRVILGLYLALVYLLGGTVATTVHEAGHFMFHWLIGDVIYEIYISPFIGQVLALVLFFIGKGRRWGLFLGTFFMLLIFALLMDTVYLCLGGLFKFGDPYEAAKNFGISSSWMFVSGALLSVFNLKVLRRPFGEWFSMFCPQRTTGEHREILYIFVISLFVICLPYYTLCFLLCGK